VRHRLHGNYQIFYRHIGNPIERIDILHILHGARNYPSILFE
jgi:plasmid stabilization system protein ParE